MTKYLQNIVNTAQTIYLVRHGETDWNRSGTLIGQNDISLNKNGRNQAAKVAQWLKTKGIQSIYASTLSRARETSLIISKATNIEINLDSRLREINAGLWTGRDKEKLKKEEAAVWFSWRNGNENIKPSLAESYKDLQNRSMRAFNEICQGMERTAVVTHHGVIRVILAQLLDVEILDIEKEYYIPPASTTIIQKSVDGTYAAKNIGFKDYLEE